MPGRNSLSPRIEAGDVFDAITDSADLFFETNWLRDFRWRLTGIAECKGSECICLYSSKGLLDTSTGFEASKGFTKEWASGL